EEFQLAIRGVIARMKAPAGLVHDGSPLINARSLSVRFTMKRIGCAFGFFGVVQLRKNGFSKTSVAPEMPPGGADDRARSEVGQLVRPVRLMECAVWNLQAAQAFQALK